MLFNVLLEAPGFCQAAFGKGGVLAGLRQRGKLHQDIKQEEGQPDTLPASVLAHKVHAIIPVAASHQRQAVLTKFQAMFNRPHQRGTSMWRSIRIHSSGNE